jgi:hypothetical protein
LLGYWVEETEFVEGKDNKICDALLIVTQPGRSETDKGLGVKSAAALATELKLDPRALYGKCRIASSEEK